MLVRDLVRKYGWETLAILPSIQAGNALPNGNVYFVDSGASNTLDAADEEHGNKWDMPFATIDYAVGRCTDSNGDIILVAPGHNEGLGSAETIDFDIAGITVIGIGVGSVKPTIDFDHATAAVDIGASNVWVKGLRFRPSVTDVAIGIDIEAAITGTILEDCVFEEGEDGSGVDEFILGVDVKAGCTDTKILNCLIRSQVAAAGCTAGVKFTGASDNCIVKGCRIIGNFSTAGIHNDTGACTDLLIEDCTIKVKDGEPGIEVVSTTTGIIRDVDIESTGITADNAIVAADMAWFGATVVTADGTASVTIGTGETEAALAVKIVEYKLDHLAYVADGTDVFPASLATDSVLAKIMCSGAAATAATFDNTTDSLEAIANALLAGTGCTAAIEADDLDHLCKLDGATQVYPENVAIDSILAKMLAKGDPATPSSYSCVTDSQEMISDKLGGFSGDGGAAQDDSAKASLDLVNTAQATAITQVGTEFWVKKTLTSSAIVQAGVDVTGVSSTGELTIVDVIVKTDSTGLVAGTNLELLTDNTNGLVNFFVETVANLGASKTVDLTNASVTKIKTVVEVGKKIIAKATVADCTGAGTIDIYIKFQRLTNAATIAAAG